MLFPDLVGLKTEGKKRTEIFLEHIKQKKFSVNDF